MRIRLTDLTKRRSRATTCAAAVYVVAVCAAIGAQAQRPKAEATPIVETEGVHAGTSVRLALRVSLPEGVHVQSNRPRDPALIPTALTLEPPAGITVLETIYPESTDLTQPGQRQPLAVFEQRFVIGVRLRVDRSLSPGEVVVQARLRYQACDAISCYAPAREETRWTLRVVPEGTAVASRYPEVFNKIRFGR